MKKTRIKQIGKIGRMNLAANRKLKKIYKDKEIFYCEINLPGCNNMYTAFAHRHSRHWYRDNPELLSSFNQSVLACQHCHSEIDKSEELKEDTFLRLRGEEL